MADTQDRTDNQQRTEMAKAYSSQSVEPRWYEWWERNGYFTPEVDPEKKPYTIIMPPPNVTGELHLGHALTYAIEDILIRYKRMNGYEALFLPGQDHAGINGQYVVEKQLQKEGLSRHDLGREKFLEVAWEYMEQYRPKIRYQQRRLGASCDWTRERFTLDPGPVKAVRRVFKRLYDKGLIYKGERIVNWCPRCATTLSDLEVENEEEQGFLWTLRYPLADNPEEGIIVATTRPETMLADTGVAVHPDDPRWQGMVGKTVMLPIMNRPIPVVADDAVDMEFGTGAVKVTPGHDPLDFEIGQRQSLPIISLLNPDATLNENGGLYAGQSVEEARKGVVAQLEREGYLLKVEPHTHSVPHCERCGTVLQPIVSDQWFVSMKPLAEPAMQVVREGKIKIVPERFAKVYFHWMGNIRDWPISRQLWWGHRVPVWYCENSHRFASDWEPEQVTKCVECGSQGIWQDNDVLDTWFSSGLWPFSTLGWPEETPDLDYFYPGDVMETGYDILFFWVARMIFQGLEHMGEIPFHTVYLHGMVRDEKGQKMSKSKGNAIDFVEMMDTYGADALRMALVTNSSPGNDQKFSTQRIEQAAQFANKLWNATRFVMSQGSGIGDQGSGILGSGQTDPKSLPDRWIMSRYNRTVRQVTQMIDDYQLGEAGKVLQEFVWSEYCDWYIEAAKTGLKGSAEEQQATQAVARYVLDGILKMLHPYMPYLTEELWQYLHDWPSKDEKLALEQRSLVKAAWPKDEEVDVAAERDFELIMEIIREIRNARAEAMREAPEGLKKEITGRRIEALIAGGPRAFMLREQEDVIARLARLDAAKLVIEEQLTQEQRPDKAVSLVIGEVEVVLPMAGLVDVETERQRLQSEIESAQGEIQRAEKMLSNEEFTSRAPAQVVQRERDKLEGAQSRLAKLRERLDAL